MARKSNKTAHVLNLLSGGEPEKEVQQPQEAKAETTTAKEEPEPAKAEAAPAPAPTPAITQAAAPEVPSNISIIDNGAKEADALAAQIHEELLKELEKEEGAAVTASAPVEEPSKMEEGSQKPKAEIPAAPAAEAPEAEIPAAPVTEQPKAETPTASPEASNAEISAPTPAEPEPEQEEVLELSPDPLTEPEPPAEPEPDYVMLNVMQRIVEDKIIYFMKQFEVCTCPRCKADTIALTLSGLPSKYKIVDKFAVDPLVSYYTGRLISQITVEALKACTQVKDNPRH